MSGKTLSHYRIEEKLGAGGMGEVYRAEDLRLHRPVAIKMLPDVFADDPERRARFEREAKLLAALSHGNIAAIFGLEEAEGKSFLVLELVEGDTLAHRLKGGQLPVDETLDVCRQIAEGLEAAHEKGIVHRDLKPSNIKITPKGEVKILDFGLARAFLDRSPDEVLADSPTITAAMTRPGVVLGTAAYMSPEQAKGKAVDKRTDIWAFGCILFECLTGKPAFPGETTTEIVASILKGEPDWNWLPRGIPFSVRAVMRRCLQKDPSRRLHDIADARIEMQEETRPPAEAAAKPRRPRPGILIAACTTALILGILIGPAVMRYLNPGVFSSSSPIRSSIRMDLGYRLGGEIFNSSYFIRPTRTEMAISSDGQFLVYSAIRESPSHPEKSRLYLRRLEQLEAEAVAGTEGAIMPFLSPADDWVGFWADGKLMKVPIGGGIARTLCEVSMPFGFSWGTDERIIFGQNRDSGLFVVSANGGKPESLTTPDLAKEEFSHRLPHCLPGGKGILFTIARHAWDMEPRLAVLETGTGQWRILLENGADARFLGTGHLAFLRQGILMLVRFDQGRLAISGQPIPAITNVVQALHSTESWNETGAGQFSLSSSGSLIYARGGIDPDSEDSLVWADEKGKVEPMLSSTAPFFAARISPDARRIAYSLLEKEYQIWIHDLVRGTDTKLTAEGMAEFPQWTPDGRRLVFDWLKAGVPNIYWQPIDGSSPMERLTTSEHFQWPSSMTPDGETLAFVEERVETGRDIHFLNMRDRRSRPFLNSRSFEGHPEFSPDGKWIAYVSDESGRMEVYVQPFPEGRGRWQISHDGGMLPLWAPNGKQLFYRSVGEGNEVWVVDVQTASGFSVGKPRFLMDLRGYGRGTPVRTWDISRDGRRFLAVKLEETKPQPIKEIVLVQNWFEEVKRLVPSSR